MNFKDVYTSTSQIRYVDLYQKVWKPRKPTGTKKTVVLLVFLMVSVFPCFQLEISENLENPDSENR